MISILIVSAVIYALAYFVIEDVLA